MVTDYRYSSCVVPHMCQPDGLCHLSLSAFSVAFSSSEQEGGVPVTTVANSGGLRILAETTLQSDELGGPR